MSVRESFRKGMEMPTLIKQLQNILNQYPDNGQILKEIIQNAEDAGATKVVFLMDHNTYGTDDTKLYNVDMAKYQGPAFYAYNDAVFSEEDWEGIRRLQDSIKADDPLKVGRFGLGFKSVFHMTGRHYRNFFDEFKHEARREPENVNLWMRQARHDYSVVVNDSASSPQWMCVKCYNAAKNSIKAAQYSKDAKKKSDHDRTLVNCCSDLYDEKLEELAAEMDSLLNNTDFLAHPSNNKTAFENIAAETAGRASKLAADIMARCQELINGCNNY